MTAPRAASGLSAEDRRALRWCLGTLGALLLVDVLRILLHNTMTQDDVFFLDAAYQLTDAHRLALGIWGNAFGHQTLLASYPPVAPAVVVIDVWLMRATHSVWFLKSSGVLLSLTSALLLWRALDFVHALHWRAALVLAVMAEPVSMTFYFTLRPEALLMPLMLVLFVTAGRVVEDRAAPRGVLVGATLVGIFTHWQMPATVGFLAFVIALVSVQRRSGGGFAAAYALGIAAAYSAYAAWIAASPDRLRAFEVQVLAAGSVSSWFTKIKFFAGNVLAGNLAAGSGFSVVLLTAGLLLAARLAWPNASREPEGRGRAWFQVGFLAAGLAPTVALDYVGPRAIPLNLVAVLILVEAVAGRRRLPAAWIAASTVVAAVLNGAGNALLQHAYLHRSWTQGLIGMPLAWLAVAVATWTLVHNASRTTWAPAVALSGAGLVSAAGFVSLSLDPSLPVRDDVVQAIRAEIDGPDLQSAAVLCDVRDFYLPLRLSGAPAHIYSTFPLLHYGAATFDRILADMRPTVLLSTDTLERELQADPSLAERFDAWRNSTFVLQKAFVIDGHRMAMYLRRPAVGSPARP